MNKRSDVLARRGFQFAVFTLVFLCPFAVRADTLDLSLISRFGDRDSLLETVALDAVFMAINYGINFLFIGRPAMRLGKIAFRVMAFHILLLTLGGQFADRVGAIVARLATGPGIADSMYDYHPDWISVGFYISLNFLISGIAIGTLVLFFGSRRWHLSMKAKWSVALIAAIFTNPAYAMFLEVWYNYKLNESFFSVRPA